MANVFDKVIGGGLLICVVFATLAHGAVEPWSIALFELLILTLLVLWAVKAVVEKRLELRIPNLAYPLALFLLLGIAQCITLTNSAGTLSSLSLDPESTRSAVTTLFFLVAAFWIAANFFATSARINALVSFLIVFGFIIAFLGLIQLLTESGDRLWFRPVQYGSGYLTGPFVNHNHFAGFVELIIPLPVSLLMMRVHRQYLIFYGFAAVLMAIALILSASRAGMISGGATFLFTLGLGAIYNRRVQNLGNTAHLKSRFASIRPLIPGVAIFGAMVVAIAAGSAWVGLAPVVDRIADSTVGRGDQPAETFESSRGWIWKTTVVMIKANPFTGVGVGAYETAYPKYSDKNETMVIDRAHNDYLQVLSDTGIVGGAIGLWFLFTFAYNVKRLFLCEDKSLVTIAIGCAAAVFSLLIHSVFDFNLQLPSMALIFLILNAVLSVIVVSKSNRHREA